MDAHLTNAIEVGVSFSKIACEINSKFGFSFTRNAAIGRAHRLGLKNSAMNSQRNKTPRAPRKARAVRRNPIVPAIEVEQPALRCVEVVPLQIDLMALSDEVCRYPSENAPFTFCGHPVKVGSRYCGPHHALCHSYTPAPRRPDAQRPGRKSSVRSFNEFEAA